MNDPATFQVPKYIDIYAIIHLDNFNLDENSEIL